MKLLKYGLIIAAVFMVLIVIRLNYNLRDRHPDFNIDLVIDPLAEPGRLSVGFAKIPITPQVTDTWNDFNNNAKGLFWTSTSAKGGVYGLRIRIFGSKGSIEWIQNNPGYLLFNPAKGAVKVLEKGFIEAEFSKKFSRIKFGHPEGYIDAFANIYTEFANSLLSKKKKKYFYPNEDEGFETAKFINACTISSKKKRWISL